MKTDNGQQKLQPPENGNYSRIEGMTQYKKKFWEELSAYFPLI
jgi:hypothetical protein